MDCTQISDIYAGGIKKRVVSACVSASVDYEARQNLKIHDTKKSEFSMLHSETRN